MSAVKAERKRRMLCSGCPKVEQRTIDGGAKAHESLAPIHPPGELMPLQSYWRSFRTWLVNVAPLALTIVSALLVLYLLAKGAGLLASLFR